VTAAPGSPENPLELTDPRAMRALAHPARIAILQHLALDGPSTATECAEIAGLSPSACSYHLRALARHGFVAEDRASAADGRHRPWRACAVFLSLPERPDRPVAAVAAGRLLKESLLAHFDEVRERYFDSQAHFPAEWRAASGWDQDVMHVTAGELALLRGQIRDLLAGYRRLDQAERPAGARRVHALVEMIPWFGPE
jgi:DNA-binding transcriptional ArsR family regulator